jgi:hypothetical protein
VISLPQGETEKLLIDVLAGRGATAGTLYVIRPDSYIGYRSQAGDPGKLKAYLDHIFA